MILCEYGCGKKATHQFKNRKWCCSKHASQCPVIKKKTTRDLAGSNNPMFGKKWSEETRYKQTIARKKRIPWNKGISHTQETKHKMSIAGKGRRSHRKGKRLSLEHKENLQGKIAWNKGKTGVYSEKTLEKMGKANIGKKLSEKTKKKISKSLKGSIRNPYSKLNIPLYNNYADMLTIEESPIRNVKDQNILTVICSSCKRRFIPKLTAVRERVRCLNNNGGCESRLYCSDVCKENCSIYGRSNYQEDHPKKDNKLYTPSEYKQFREYVLERDNYKCQYCGERAEQVHHERPQKLEPFFSLDPDYTWSVCKKCHYEKGHVDECSTGKLATFNCQ